MATAKVQTGLRLNEEDLHKISFIAKRTKRSLNAMIEFLIQNCIEDYEERNGTIQCEPQR